MFRRQPPPATLYLAVERAVFRSIMLTVSFGSALIAFRALAPVFGLSYTS